MPFTKLLPTSIDLAQNFTFTGTVTGAGGGKTLQVKEENKNKTLLALFFKGSDEDKANVIRMLEMRHGKVLNEDIRKKFIKELDSDYNLIIRPHFHDRNKINFLKLWAKYHGFENVYFSNPAKIIKNSTMNDFAISDLMISDTSSIIYEYLI